MQIRTIAKPDISAIFLMTFKFRICFDTLHTYDIKSSRQDYLDKIQNHHADLMEHFYTRNNQRDRNKDR